MTPMRAPARKAFFVEIIKPSHYDDDGYVIQWLRAFIPSNSLACLYALAEDAQQRRVLGDDTEIVVHAYDEQHTVIDTGAIIRRIRQAEAGGLVLLAGVQSNQFPRALDLARAFRAAGIAVAIGGFHVSGCIAMLSELTPDLREAQALGVTLFAGEGEQGRLAELIQDAYHGRMRPVYNYLQDLPGLQGEVTPFLPAHVAERSFNFTAFDVGRGCPFRCSFCTIINVQGRKSRYREADDVERIVRAYAALGVKWFFITDDNMARNKNWEAIFDRLIQLREQQGFKLKLYLQVDTMCHKIPGFIAKAARAGCSHVFIGMESVNPENLVAAKKYQNNIHEYRKMLLEWRARGVMTYAGFILGFPADTPESIERDIRLIQQELPIDILEFFMLTPLPGSADHKELHERGVWMNPDMNLYDSEHAVTAHPRMTAEQWQKAYADAWGQYYSPEHVETLLRRAQASGLGTRKMAGAILLYYGSVRFEKVHPLQSGIFRRKVRTSRRPSFPRENPLLFYPRRLWEITSTFARVGLYYLNLMKIRARILRDPQSKHYTDRALTPVQTPPQAEPQESGQACAPADEKPHLIPLTILSPAPGDTGPSQTKRSA